MDKGEADKGNQLPAQSNDGRSPSVGQHGSSPHIPDEDDQVYQECDDEACPICKEELRTDEGGGNDKELCARSPVPEHIPGIQDEYLSLEDNVSDTETTLGSTRIAPQRARRVNIDEWTSEQWRNQVEEGKWLQGMQGLELIPTLPALHAYPKPSKVYNYDLIHNIRVPLRIKAWKATGSAVELCPLYFYKSDLQIVVEAIRNLDKAHVNGLPRHIACKIDLPSSIKPISFVEWNATTFTEQNNLVCCFHVLIYDYPYIRDGAFDADTLGRYVLLDRDRAVTDLCLSPNGRRRVKATMGDVLEQGRIETRPRILSASEKLLNQSTEFASYNLCDAAFEATQGSIGPGPSNGKDWLSANNSWAYHGPQVNDGGGGTAVETIVGGQLWMVLTPKWPNEGKNDPVSPKPEDYWKVFGQKTVWEAIAKGNVAMGDLQSSQWEGVLLPPKSLFLMRANTIHKVVTVDHSIVKGSHFFNRGTLMETLLNNIVCLLGGKVFTNTEHPGMRIYIHRIILLHYDHYCLGIPHRQFQHHLLDPEKAEDMVQLQALLMLGILEDVFNPRSYAIGRANRQRRRKGEAPVGREPARAIYASYIKGISWTIVQWLTSRYTFSTAGMHGRTPWTLTIQRFKEDWWYDIVGRQLAIIETWRTRLVRQGIQGPVYDNTEEEIAENTKTLAEQVALVVEHHPSIDEAYQKCLRAPGECISPLVEFSWGSRTWKTTKVQEPFEVREGWQIVRLGTNSSDMQVFQAAGDGPFVLPAYADA